MNRLLVAATVVALGSGCITQRSMGILQTARPVGKGGADVAASASLMYQSQTAPPVSSSDPGGQPVNTTTTRRGFQLPWFEGNFNYGLGEQVGLNVHMSPAGIQPGLKWTLNRSSQAWISLLPEIGAGYFSVNNSDAVSNVDGRQLDRNVGYVSSFIFMAGMKILISHRSGFYGAVGYDFLFTSNFTQTSVGTAASVSKSTLTSTQHQIQAGVGMSIPVGWLSIRPEISFAFVPAITGAQTTQIDDQMPSTIGAGGGYAWALTGGFAFAITSPPDRSDKGAEEDAKNVDGDDEKEKEDEEEKPAPRRRKKTDDDDDDSSSRGDE